MHGVMPASNNRQSDIYEAKSKGFAFFCVQHLPFFKTESSFIKFIQKIFEEKYLISSCYKKTKGVLEIV